MSDFDAAHYIKKFMEEDKHMNRIWANRVWARAYRFSQVPASRQQAVKQLMHEDVGNGKMGCTPELYEELIGEPYVPAN